MCLRADLGIASCIGALLGGWPWDGQVHRETLWAVAPVWPVALELGVGMALAWPGALENAVGMPLGLPVALGICAGTASASGTASCIWTLVLIVLAG